MTICQAAWAKVLRGALAGCAVGAFERQLGGFLVGRGRAKLAPHLPADPEQQDATGEKQADDLEQLDGQAGENDAQDRRGDDADQDGLVTLFLGETGRRKADDDGVVAGQNEVDHHHLQEGGDLG